MKKILLFLFLAISALAGTLIEFEPGRHYVNKPIFIEKDDVTIDGKGCILQLSKHANCPVIVIGERSLKPKKTVTNVHIKNIIIDGGKDYQDSEYMTGMGYLRNNCITVRGAENVYLDNVVTANSMSGGIVCELKSRNILIDGVNSYGNVYDGIAICESTGVYVMNSILQFNNAAGLSMDWGADMNRFKNITLAYNLDLAIFMRDSNSNIFNDIDTGNGGVFVGLRDPDNKKTGCFNNTFLFINPPVMIHNNEKCLNNVFLLKVKK